VTHRTRLVFSPSKRCAWEFMAVTEM
jgi:hypothetical protein